jgi:hypothetical protein
MVRSCVIAARSLGWESAPNWAVERIGTTNKTNVISKMWRFDFGVEIGKGMGAPGDWSLGHGVGA